MNQVEFWIAIVAALAWFFLWLLAESEKQHWEHEAREWKRIAEEWRVLANDQAEAMRRTAAR